MADAQGKEAPPPGGRRRPLSIDLNLPTLLLLLLLLVFPVNSTVLILAASSLPQSKLTHPICKSLTAGKSLCNQPAAGVFFFLPSIRADESTILGLKEVRLVALVFFFPSQFLHPPSYRMLPFFNLIVPFLLTEHVRSAGRPAASSFLHWALSALHLKSIHFFHTPRFIFSVPLSGKIHLILMNWKHQLSV